MRMACIYVALGSGGTIKIGQTGDAAIRFYGLRRQFKLLGDVLINFEPCFSIKDADTAELQLRYWARKNMTPFHGSEWFRGGDFDSVVKQARLITHECRNKIPYQATIDREHKKLETKQ